MMINRDRRVADVETVYDPDRGQPLQPRSSPPPRLLLQEVTTAAAIRR